MRFLLLFVALAALVGCNPLNQEDSCTLVLHFYSEGGVENKTVEPDSPRDKTILPSASFQINEYQLTGTGPGEENLDVTTGESQVSSVLVPGEWSFYVQGFNPEGILLAEGYASAFLYPGEKRSLEILLLPLTGTGRLLGTIQWPLGLPPETSLAISLTPLFSQEEQQVFNVSPPETVLEIDSLSAGYHNLSASLSDGTSLFSGLREVIRILSGQDTFIALSFSLETASLSLTVAENLYPPLEPILIPGEQLAGVRGFPVKLKTLVENAQGPLEISWYSDSRLVAEGLETALETRDLPSSCRVDVVALCSTSYRAGSSSALLNLTDPVSLGPMAFHSRFLDGLEGCDGLRGARSLAWHPGGAGLVVSGYDDNALSLYTPDLLETVNGPVLFGLTYSGAVKTAGENILDGPWSLCFSPQGDHLFMGCYKANQIHVFSVAENPFGLVYETTVTEKEGEWLDPLGISSLAGVCSLAVSRDGAFLYAASALSNCLVLFSLQEGLPQYIATLRPEEPYLLPWSEPRHLSLSPNGEFLYLASYTGDSLLLFHRNGETGSLQLLETFTDGQEGIEGLNAPEEIAVSPDGRSLYVISYYDHSISHFQWNQDFTSLSIVALYKDGVGGITGLSSGRSLSISPDGSLVAAVSSGSDAVVLFQRDQGTGDLLLLASLSKGEPGLPGLDNPRGISFSPQLPEYSLPSSGGSPILAVTGSASNDLLLFLTPP